MKTKTFQKSDARGAKYAMLTAYDALTSGILEGAGVDFILVGDSVGMVLLGYPNTAMVTMDEMLHHSKAVRRGAPKSFILGDLPKKGIVKGPAQTLASARRFVAEASLDGVKLEWSKDCLMSTELMVRHKILVQGHVGLTPQAVKNKSGFKVQGKDASSALEIIRQAKAFEDAGASLLLMECVPWEVAQIITNSLRIPTIGIGAGPYCDGQVLVFHDLIGMFQGYTPKFVKHYAETGIASQKAAAGYVRDVRAGRFPGLDQSFRMDAAQLAKLRELMPAGGKKR